MEADGFSVGGFTPDLTSMALLEHRLQGLRQASSFRDSNTQQLRFWLSRISGVATPLKKSGIRLIVAFAS